MTGEILARIHGEWTRVVTAAPVTALASDLAETPGSFSHRENDIIGQALAVLADEPVAVGRLYLDFKPSNVLCRDDALSLVDAPEECSEGVLLWDFALFRSYLRRELWKSTTTPWSRRRRLLQKGLVSFQRGYVESWGRISPDTAVSRLLVCVLELQRAGQLLALQRGKIQLARYPGGPLAWRRDPLGLAYTAVTIPVLASQKRRLVVEMGRLLGRCDKTAGNAPRTTIYLGNRDTSRMS
jgi:hypothetical protein